MRTKPYKSLSSYLTGTANALSQFTRRTKKISEIQEIFDRLIDHSLATHCKVLNFSQGCLSLSITNAHFATPIRYLVPDFIEILRSEGKMHSLARIQCAIESPKVNKPKPRSAKPYPAPLSTAQADQLLALADTLSHPALREALQKLAKHT